jgi:membrane protein YqaA with SNARE-associated domain
VIDGDNTMRAIRFFFLLFVFFGIVAACAVTVLLGILMLRFVPVLIIVILSCLIFSWLLKD